MIYPCTLKKIWYFTFSSFQKKVKLFFFLNSKQNFKDRFSVSMTLANRKNWRTKYMNIKYPQHMYLMWASIPQPTVSDLHSQSYGGLVGPAPGHVSDGVPSPSQQQQGQVPLLHVLHTLPVTCNHKHWVSFLLFSNIQVIDKMSHVYNLFWIKLQVIIFKSV